MVFWSRFPSAMVDWDFIISLSILYCLIRLRMSVVEVPEPFAILDILEVSFSRTSGFSIS